MVKRYQTIVNGSITASNSIITIVSVPQQTAKVSADLLFRNHMTIISTDGPAD